MISTDLGCVCTRSLSSPELREALQKCTDKLKSCLLLHKYLFETPHAALATHFAMETRQSGVWKNVLILLAGTLVWYKFNAEQQLSMYAANSVI